MKHATVLIVLCGASFMSAQAKSRDIAAAVFGGEAALKQFLNAKEVTAQRIHKKPDDVPRQIFSPYSLASYTRDSGVVLSRAQADSLQALLGSQASYLWTHDVPDDTPVMVNQCLPDYGVLFTCKGPDGAVQLAFCMKCNLFAVFVGAANDAERVNVEEDLDAMKPTLTKLLKELFPHDDDITEFRRKRPNQAMQPTAGRSEATSQFMTTYPFQVTLALASGG